MMSGSAAGRWYVQPGARFRVSPELAPLIAVCSAEALHGTHSVLSAGAARAAGTDPKHSAAAPPMTVTAVLAILKYISSSPVNENACFWVTRRPPSSGVRTHHIPRPAPCEAAMPLSLRSPDELSANLANAGYPRSVRAFRTR